jgi:hypothetical protein
MDGLAVLINFGSLQGDGFIADGASGNGDFGTQIAHLRTSGVAY